jgi:nucleoside phosphorylase
MSTIKKLSHAQYTVGWICALPLEMAAAKAMLDQTHARLSQPTTDHNNYILGEIEGHNVVIVCLPSGVYGTISAAVVLSHMLSTFPFIQFGVMVGIGGGVPLRQTDIRLGDVVVSKPVGTSTGVIQYDYGKTVTGGRFEATGVLNLPPQILLTAISQLQSRDLVQTEEYIVSTTTEILDANPEMAAAFSCPGQEHDQLFNAAYDHIESQSDETRTECVECDPNQLVQRIERTSNAPRVHYGLIASGNQVMKHGQTRDRLAEQYNILCFEMEAAGLMNQLACLVIRGICDYSDSHKDKKWQGFAALTAAAYTKQLLSIVSVRAPVKGAKEPLTSLPPTGLGSRFFTGRSEELQTIRVYLTADDSEFQPRAVIWGVGGAGKTQLALQYASEYKREFSAIILLNAYSAESFRKDCLQAAKIIGLLEVAGSATDEENPRAQDAVVDAVIDWLTKHEEGDWLLIIDNADNLDTFNIKAYLPRTNKGQVIITSQNSQSASYGHSVELGPMTTEDATHLFFAIAGIKHQTNEDKAIGKEIVTLLGRLALAVEHAAACVGCMKTPLPKYLEDLKENLLLILEDAPPDSFHENTVQVTVTMAWEAVEKRNPKAARLLIFLGFLSPQSVSEDLLLQPLAVSLLGSWAVSAGRTEYLRAKKLLLSFSLIRAGSTQATGATVSMHGLVHRFVSPLADQKDQWVWVTRAITFLSKVKEGKPPEGSIFAHIHEIAQTSVSLYKRDNRQPVFEVFWPMMALDTFKYRSYWQTMGLAGELEELCKIVNDALSKAGRDKHRLFIGFATTALVCIVDLTSSPDTLESVMKQYLLDELQPSARAFVSYVDNGGKIDERGRTSFNPSTLGHVFKDITLAPHINILIEVLKTLAFIYARQAGRQMLGKVLFRLSQLPASETWTSLMRRMLPGSPSFIHGITEDSTALDLPSWTHIAEIHRAAGKFDTTIDLLRHLIDQETPVLRRYGEKYDLIKLLRKLKRDEEIAEVLSKLPRPADGAAERKIAEECEIFYIWLRKVFVDDLQHPQHSQAERILRNTYETALHVFGKTSLSAAHGAFLLEIFYSQQCCYSADGVEKYRGERQTTFEQLLGGRSNLLNGSFLQMGKYLLAQGEFDVAVIIFDMLLEAARDQLGSEAPMTKRALALLTKARMERSIEVRDNEAGRVGTFWGSLMFVRPLETLESETA